MANRLDDRPWARAVALLSALLLTLALLAGCSAARMPVAPAPQSPVVATSSAPAGTPATETSVPSASAEPTVFAVIGDYGANNAHERDVAALVASWHPAFVLALGDDYYRQAGGTGVGRYERSTGAYYGRWLRDVPAADSRQAGTAARNAFFPALGNHDYSDATPSPATYLDYFTLPGSGFTSSSGNERYYDFVEGPVHFFVLNSNTQEPDGTSSSSTQAGWLQEQMSASTSTWNVVYDHHPPYSSDTVHGSTGYMQWPFAAWGADAVLSGHAHAYERIEHDGIVYFVNGLGGAPRYDVKKPVNGSAARYQADWGAQKVTASDTALEFQFYNVAGSLVDSYSVTTTQPQGK